jgi:glycerophosphoryl diester phosphodiesterase
LVFAHRGGSALAPENTMAAFANGLSFGANGIELTIACRKKSGLSLSDDQSIARQRAPAPWPRCLSATARPDDAARGCSKGLPEARGSVLKVNARELASAVVDVVRRANAVERVCLGAFGRRVLNAARTLEPALATSAAREEVRWALYRSWVRRASHGAPYAGFQVPESAGTTRIVSRRFVEIAHRADLAVHVWTVDDEADANRLLSWGVDALITDRPDVITRVAQAFRPA